MTERRGRANRLGPRRRMLLVKSLTAYPLLIMLLMEDEDMPLPKDAAVVAQRVIGRVTDFVRRNISVFPSGGSGVFFGDPARRKTLFQALKQSTFFCRLYWYAETIQSILRHALPDNALISDPDKHRKAVGVIYGQIVKTYRARRRAFH